MDRKEAFAAWLSPEPGHWTCEQCAEALPHYYETLEALEAEAPRNREERRSAEGRQWAMRRKVIVKIIEMVEAGLE